MKKIKELIKRNYLFIILIIISYLFFTFPLPYYVEAPGGLINLNNRFKIENEYKKKGSINMTYVSELKGTPLTLLYAKIKSDCDIVKKDTIVLNKETEEESNFRGSLMLKEANDNAIILAYTKASKKIEIKSTKIFVTYIDKQANTNLKIKDQIIEVEGIKVNTKEETNKIIASNKVGKKIKIKVINNNKEYTRYAEIINYKNYNIIGILVTYERDLNTDPIIKTNFTNSEAGSSGGLMATLEIYNSLSKDDITKGKRIAGTGTIDLFGNVGEIDGIKYKLKGAEKEKADVFLTSSYNYDEAVKIKKEKNYKIVIVKIDTFDQALEYLKKM